LQRVQRGLTTAVIVLTHTFQQNLLSANFLVVRNTTPIQAQWESITGQLILIKAFPQISSGTTASNVIGLTMANCIVPQHQVAQPDPQISVGNTSTNNNSFISSSFSVAISICKWLRRRIKHQHVTVDSTRKDTTKKRCNQSTKWNSTANANVCTNSYCATR